MDSVCTNRAVLLMLLLMSRFRLMEYMVLQRPNLVSMHVRLLTGLDPIWRLVG
jgi:hypothetical protein